MTLIRYNVEYVEYLGQMLVLRAHPHPHTYTHTIALPGPLNWSVIIHAGCVAAGVGVERSDVSISLSIYLFVRALKGKRYELSPPKSVDIIVGMH